MDIISLVRFAPVRICHGQPEKNLEQNLVTAGADRRMGGAGEALGVDRLHLLCVHSRCPSVCLSVCAAD